MCRIRWMYDAGDQWEVYSPEISWVQALVEPTFRNEKQHCSHILVN